MICAHCQNFTFETKYKLSGFGKCLKQPHITPGLETYEGIFISPIHERECDFYREAKEMGVREQWLLDYRKGRK